MQQKAKLVPHLMALIEQQDVNKKKKEEKCGQISSD
jgi:hypothetical protein